MSENKSLADELRSHINHDHARGCEGRSYACSCRYDESTEGLLERAAQALSDVEVTDEMVEAAAKQIAMAAGDSSEDWPIHKHTARDALEAAHLSSIGARNAVIEECALRIADHDPQLADHIRALKEGTKA